MTIPDSECPNCLGSLLEAALDGCGLTGDLRRLLRGQALAHIIPGLAAGQVPAVIASTFLARLRRASGVNDPFAEMKAHDFAAARRAVAELGAVPDSFAKRCQMAVMGNAADQPFIAATGDLWKEGARVRLGVDQLARAEERLRHGARVVILADNCGEQCFDRILVEHLGRRGSTVTYVVKSGPAQNDLTLEDLTAQGEAHGLGRIMASGTEQVGLDPATIPPHLAQELARADLVIAKGMGHYESFRPLGDKPPWPLLMLFVAKCGPVARSLGLAVGQGAALFRG